jgi:hypothetical protein
VQLLGVPLLVAFLGLMAYFVQRLFPANTMVHFGGFTGGGVREIGRALFVPSFWRGRRWIDDGIPTPRRGADTPVCRAETHLGAPRACRNSRRGSRRVSTRQAGVPAPR